MNDTTKELYDFRCTEIRNNTKDRLDYLIKVKDYQNFKDILTESDFNAHTRAKANRSAKRYRNNRKMREIVHFDRLRAHKGVYTEASKLAFGTATFNNESLYLKNGKQKQDHTLARYINQYLKEHYLWAIVNIDYGKKTERLHFHWIGKLKPNEEIERIYDTKTGEINSSKKGNEMYELKDKTWKYGFEPTLLIVEENRNEKNDFKTLTNYLLKINNHSNKPSTKNHRIRVIGDTRYMRDYDNYMLLKSFQ